MMFTQHAQDMGFDGAHLVVQPRASGAQRDGGLLRKCLLLRPAATLRAAIGVPSTTICLLAAAGFFPPTPMHSARQPKKDRLRARKSISLRPSTRDGGTPATFIGHTELDPYAWTAIEAAQIPT